MALQDILEKILNDAQQQAEQIKQEAAKEAEAILQQARKRAEEIKQAYIAKAEQRARQEKDRIITLAQLEFRKALLKEKQNAIQEAFRKAQERLSNLDGSKYQALIKNLLVQAVETGDEEVIVSPRDRKVITPAFLQEISPALGKGDGTLKLSTETRDIAGGFILRRGRMEINYSFEAIFKLIRDDLVPEVAAILFGERKG